MDDESHRQITGVSNKLILENITKLDGQYPRLSVIVRMPVIPTINDSQENITAMGAFCVKLKSVKKIQLLPYHRLGIETYKRLFIPYSLNEIEVSKQKSKSANRNL